MPIASKISSFIERASWIRKMFEEGAALRAEFGDQNVYDFTLGNPTVEPPEELQQELKKLADNPVPGMHRYMNNAGYEETRAAVAEVIAEKSRLPVSGAQVIMTCGAGAALNVVLKTLLNPGDEVIILTPFFVEYKFYIDNQGGIPVEVVTEDDFQPDLDAIASAVSDRTRAVIINSPNNPTGVIYPEATLKKLGRMLAAKEKSWAQPSSSSPTNPTPASASAKRCPASLTALKIRLSSPHTPKIWPCRATASATWRPTRIWTMSNCSSKVPYSATVSSASSMPRP